MTDSADANTSPLTRLGECERALVRSANAPGGLVRAVRDASARCRAPMRVAVVAQIKRGKSTLVNALLRQDVAPTAQLEATFTVGEFHHTASPRVVVHFTSPDTAPLTVDPAEFRTFTINDPARTALLRSIRRVEFGLPNPLLERFRLLDTPGLGSIHRVDSDNTLSTLGVEGFLEKEEEQRLERVLRQVGRTAADLHADTVTAMDSADAVVYLFDRALNERDASLVVRFLGPLNPSLNALKVVGVLSRCDQWYWPPVDDEDADPVTFDPLAVARRIVDRYLAQPATRRMFFRILPVAALPAAGAAALTDEQLRRLDVLAAVEPGRLALALGDANRFARAPTITGVDLCAAERAELVATLGAWGTLRCALHRRDGVGVAELSAVMQVESGVADVRRTLLEHFGNRSGALKLDQALRDVTTTVTRLRMDAVRTGRPVSPTVANVAGTVEQIRLDDTEMAELGVLDDYYQGHLDFGPDDADEILRVSGEHGRSVAARLALAPDAPLPVMAAAADERAGAWTTRSEVFGLDGATAAAARQVAVSYARLSRRIRTARRLLQWDDEYEGPG